MSRDHRLTAADPPPPHRADPPHRAEIVVISVADLSDTFINTSLSGEGEMHDVEKRRDGGDGDRSGLHRIVR